MQQLPNPTPRNHPWIPIRICNREIRRALDVSQLHPNRLQRHRSTQRRRQIPHPARRFVCPQRLRHPSHRLPSLRRVKRHRMRQDHRMRLRMRQIERPSQRVAQLVMQRHPDGSQHRPAEPSPIQRLRPSVCILRILHNRRQRRRERPNPVLRHQRHNRIRVFGVKCFDAMRHRIDAAGNRQRNRQR